MKKTIALFAASTALLVGCSNEETIGDSNASSNFVTVSLEQEPGTRMSADWDGYAGTTVKMTWDTNDAIYMSYAKSANANGDNGNGIYILASGEGTSTGVFGLKSGDAYSAASGVGCDFAYVAFPDSYVSKIYGGTLTMKLPSEYLADDFGKCQIPMFGKTQGLTDETIGNFNIKWLGSALRLTVESIPAGYDYIILESGDSPLSGTFTASTTDSNPVLAGVTGSTSKEIKMWFPSSESAETRVFYIPIPCGTYSSLTLKVGNSTSGDLGIVKRWSSSNTFERRLMYKASVTWPTVVVTPTAVNQSLQSSKNVYVTGDFENDATAIEVKQVSGRTSTIAFNGNITNATEENPLTINSSNTNVGDGKAIDYILISANGAKVDSGTVCLTLNGPQTTYELANTSKDSILYYKKVVANTALSTLIIDENVQINTLEVLGGNVIVKGKAKVNNISISENANTETVKLYPLSQCATPTGKSINVYNVPGDDSQTPSYKNGGTIEW